VIHWDVSPLIRAPLDELIATPVFVRVGTISEETVLTFRESVDAALTSGQPVIPVLIDSPGGDIQALFSCLDILDGARRHVKIATVVEGRAFSAGAALFTAGDQGLRYCGPRASVMIHEASTTTRGKVGEVAADVRESLRLNQAMFDAMDKNCRKKSGSFQRLIHNVHGHSDWYLTPTECVKHGLANHIGIPELGIKVTVEYGFGVAGDE
jgi:ATP-dependent Clp protease protease subunit